MRDTDLLRRLRRKGLHVVEVAGWQTRGASSLDVKVVVNHHTAGPRRGVAPSLGTCINGRPDLPGPLCNVYKARDQTVYLVAAGRANHAGSGGWKGVTGNSHTLGNENENTGLGDEPWSEDDIDTMARMDAALAEGHCDAEHVCQHFEWAPRRKIDAYRINPTDFRFRVASYLGAAPPKPQPRPTPNPEDDMTPEQATMLKEAHAASQKAMVYAKAAMDELQSHGEDGDGRGPYLPRIRDSVASTETTVKWVQRVLAKVKGSSTA